MTCKLYLVPEDVINSWRSEQREKTVDRPVSTVASHIDSKMDSILKENISDYDKEKLYSQELEKYRTLRNQSVKPTLPTASRSPLSLTSIPKMYHRKAEGLLDYLRSTKDISWDERGQLQIGHHKVDRSHILDLIHDAIRFRKTSKRPKGWRELSAYLQQRNIPRELVGNPSWLSSTPSTSTKGQDTDPYSSDFVTYSDEGDDKSDTTDKPKPSSSLSKHRPSKIRAKSKIRKWLSLEKM